MRGTTKPIRHLGGGTGFAGLTSSVRERVAASVSHDRRVRVAMGGVDSGEAAVKLGVTADTVPELIRRGHLRVIAADRTGTGRRRIDVASLEAFEAAHVTAKLLAPLLGCHPSHSSERLRRIGINPIMDPGTPARFTPIVRRADVASLGGFGPGFDAPSQIRELWAYFRAEIGVRCPGFKPPAECSLRQDRRARPCLSEFHSPRPNGFRPVLSIKRYKGPCGTIGGRRCAKSRPLRLKMVCPGIGRASPSKWKMLQTKPSAWRRARWKTSRSISTSSIAKFE